MSHRISNSKSNSRARWPRIGSILTRLKLRFKSGIKSLQSKHEAKIADKSGLSISSRREDLSDLYEHFELYVEVLCDAAQFGASRKLAAQFDKEASFLAEHYPKVQNYLSAYLRPLPDDAQKCFEASGKCGDLIESMIAYDNLQHFLETDDGYMISRITRARAAFMLYAENLRQAK